MSTTIKANNGGINIWMSNYGQYQIPERFIDIGIVIAKSGWPDRRYAASQEAQDFRAWIAEQDRAARAEMERKPDDCVERSTDYGE